MIAVMVYTRASASDYDDWETVYKNPGWGSKELIPLLQKVRGQVESTTLINSLSLQAETFDRNAPYHGYTGPIKVSHREDELNVADDFLDVVGKYDKKRQFTDDVNGFFSCDAYGVRIFFMLYTYLLTIML